MVTPTGVREGDPSALAALCAVRGPSVVAYCRHVAGEAYAGAAAADAFARFRVGVVSAGDTISVDPEALLISATRTSAAANAHPTGQGDCADVPALLAARADKTIASAELERLESHLEDCPACRAPVARFKAAERAYRDPPEKTVDPALSAQIVGALIAAVPPAPPPDLNLSSNGSAEHAPLVPPAAAPDVPLDQPTEQFSALEPETAPEPRLPAVAPERQGRSRARLRLAFVLPIVLIVLALTGALYVSGMFGGNDPQSSSTVAAPTAEPVETTKPELVVVPGAKNASAAAVEDAKARARGEVEPSGAKKDKAKADAADEAPAPAASRPPPAAAGPAPAASPPPPPASANGSPAEPAPDPKPQTKPAEETQIDAGGGATGAEQVAPPPASDAPELAPPPASATSP